MTALKCPLCDHTEPERHWLAQHLITSHPNEMAQAAAGLSGEREFLGRFMGEDVWISADHKTVWTHGIDFAYPLDLNGTFQNWVARHIDIKEGQR